MKWIDKWFGTDDHPSKDQWVDARAVFLSDLEQAGELMKNKSMFALSKLQELDELHLKFSEYKEKQTFLFQHRFSFNDLHAKIVRALEFRENVKEPTFRIAELIRQDVSRFEVLKKEGKEGGSFYTLLDKVTGEGFDYSTWEGGIDSECALHRLEVVYLLDAYQEVVIQKKIEERAIERQRLCEVYK